MKFASYPALLLGLILYNIELNIQPDIPDIKQNIRQDTGYPSDGSPGIQTR